MDTTERYVCWIEALRESTHSQAKGIMYDGEGYDVYGILELAVYEECFTLRETDQPHQVDFTWTDSLGMNLEPHPARIREMELGYQVSDDELWKACGHFTPKITEMTRLDLLGQMNDAGVSFSSIADFMEEAGWGARPAACASYPAALGRILHKRVAV